MGLLVEGCCESGCCLMGVRENWFVELRGVVLSGFLGGGVREGGLYR